MSGGGGGGEVRILMGGRSCGARGGLWAREGHDPTLGFPRSPWLHVRKMGRRQQGYKESRERAAEIVQEGVGGEVLGKRGRGAVLDKCECGTDSIS